jgi:hypothetical protein
MSVAIDGGFGLDIGFIDRFNSRLVTAINYSDSADLHASEIAKAHSSPFQSAVSSPVVPGNGF